MEDSSSVSDGNAAERAPRELTPSRLAFSGNGTEYFRIWIVNLTLSLLTLGIYSAWAKVRTNRYFYGSTTLAGDTFEYHAVFTDELIHLADNDQQLLAVYFHELGHAELRHVEQSILQNSAWVVLFSVIVGDFSGAGELLVSLPLVVGQMAYSRELEREADQYAIDALLEVGLDPDALADILEKLDRAHTLTNADADSATEAPPVAGAEKSDSVSETAADANRTEAGDAQAKDWAERVFEYLSTHPATDERLAHIRSFSTTATRDATR